MVGTCPGSPFQLAGLLGSCHQWPDALGRWISGINWQCWKQALMDDLKKGINRYKWIQMLDTEFQMVAKKWQDMPEKISVKMR